MPNKLIGVSGFAQSGKDTFGNYLVTEHGFKRVAFADAVRDAVYEMDPIIGNNGANGRKLWEPSNLRLRDYIDVWGWDHAKTHHPEARGLLQKMGTEVGRMLFGDTVWIDIAKRKMEGAERVVVTDVRFENEADFIRSEGGVVVQISRPGVTAVNSHASDQLDFEPDTRVLNDGTIEDLCAHADSLLESIE